MTPRKKFNLTNGEVGTSSIGHTQHRPSASTHHHPARKYNFTTEIGIDPLLLPSFWCALSAGKSSKSSNCNLISFGSQKSPSVWVPGSEGEQGRAAALGCHLLASDHLLCWTHTKSHHKHIKTTNNNQHYPLAPQVEPLLTLQE